ncbi:hypothetical protein BC835DRAFT_1328424 [Cytidiella melzeri]|nr:hypothetical protein BC835DRAFT_1328424 [Cytidiella melzeri]
MAATYPSGVHRLLRVPAPFDTTFSLVTSPVVSPTVLAIVRLTLAVYGTIFILARLLYEGIILHTDNSFFAYFTTLSYVGLISYFWATGVQTLLFTFCHHTSYPLQHWPRPLQFLHLLLHSTITTLPILVTIIFWSLLSSPSTFSTRYDAWINISEHVLNTVSAAFEILCTNATPSSPAYPQGVNLPLIHLPFILLILAGYLGVAYITKTTQGFYTYSFLDPSTEHAKLAVYIVGVALAATVIFILVRYICVARSWLFHRKARGGGGRRQVSEEEERKEEEEEDNERKKKKKRGAGGGSDEWVEVRVLSRANEAAV